MDHRLPSYSCFLETASIYRPAEDNGKKKLQVEVVKATMGRVRGLSVSREQEQNSSILSGLIKCLVVHFHLIQDKVSVLNFVPLVD